MGSIESQGFQLQQFNTADWKPVPWQPYTHIKDLTFYSNFIVYTHKNNPHLQIQKYDLVFNSQAEYISYLETFYQRKKCSSLVNSVHIQSTSKKGMCSTFITAEVYLEHICLRLMEIIDIPVEEGLFVLDSAFLGYEKMFSKTGYFDVSSDMMGVTKQGKVKVWVNKNFSKNFPEFNKINHNKGESQFIFDIIRLIQKLIDYTQEIEKFSSFCKTNYSSLNFSTAKIALREYHQKHKITNVKAMKSIILWVKKNKQSRTIIYQNECSSKKKENIDHFCNSNKNNANGKSICSQDTKNLKKIPFVKVKSRKASYQHRGMSNAYSFVTDCETNKDNSKTFSLSKAVNNEISQVKKNSEKQENWSQKRPSNLIDFMGEQTTHEIKPISKIPSTSLTYKHNFPYSPQNMNKQGWFGSKKDKDQNEDKKYFRRSLVKNKNPKIEYKSKAYLSKDHSHQMDAQMSHDQSIRVQ